MPGLRRFTLLLARLLQSQKFAAVVLAVLAALLTSCGPPAPPKAPVRELPQDAGAYLALASARYGDTAPIDIGPTDRGSRAAQATFESLTGRAVVHEPALDLVAAVLARTFADEGQSPVYSLTQWLYWKCGAASVPGPSNVLGVAPGLEGAFEQHLGEVARNLPRDLGPLSYGLVRVAVPGGTVQAVALGVRALEIVPVAKQQAPGATLSIDGKVLGGFKDPIVYVEREGADPAEIPMTVAEGRATATLQLPAKPGRYFLQIEAAEPPRAEGAQPWHKSLFWAPLYVGVAEPAVADEFIRRPPKNHPDKSSWALQIQAAYNAERQKLGRAPLTFQQEASLIAQSDSDAHAAVDVDPPPDASIAQRLADAGLPPRDFMHSVGWMEFVAEYTQMRLLQPWVRFRVLRPNLSVLALGVSQRPSKVGGVSFTVAEYAFEPVRVDPPKERERILAEIEALESKASRKPPSRDDGLSLDAQRLADVVCGGGKQPASGEELWAQVKTRAPDLRHRMASSGPSYDISKQDIAEIAKPLAGGTYTKMGVGVCQGRVEGRANVSYVMLLLMGP
jgi:uncharacterized protein YkwD